MAWCLVRHSDNLLQWQTLLKLAVMRTAILGVVTGPAVDMCTVYGLVVCAVVGSTAMYTPKPAYFQHVYCLHALNSGSRRDKDDRWSVLHNEELLCTASLVLLER
jgi:hypothetical protein